MRWILEVGNTRTKWAGFDPDLEASAAPLVRESSAKDDFSAVQSWTSAMASGDEVMVSGSGNLDPWLDALDGAVVLRQGDPIPLHTNVTEPDRLGLDRVANMWALIQGAVPSADPLGNWLVVDVGTCVTVDLVKQGHHIGGTISPGIGMRLSAMSDGTQHLPELVWPIPSASPHLASTALGEVTEDALLAGAAGGVSAEIEGKWAALSQEVPNLGVVLTGGDSEHLELRNIRPKFADAHLTLKGYHALFTHLQA